MWRKQDEPKPTPTPGDRVVSPAPERTQNLATSPNEPRTAAGHVSSAIVIKGELTGNEDLFIDGEVKGTIRLADGNLTVGPNGRVTADIDAREITVQGKVTGALRGRERVQIARTGEAEGDIVTRRVSIEEGAVFHGKIDVVRAEEARAARAGGMTPSTDSKRRFSNPADDSPE